MRHEARSETRVEIAAIGSEAPVVRLDLELLFDQRPGRGPLRARLGHLARACQGVAVAAAEHRDVATP